MDGTGRKEVIRENILWPNGITIDYPTDTIYWVDAKKKTLESANLDGLERRKVKLQFVFNSETCMSLWISLHHMH